MVENAPLWPLIHLDGRENVPNLINQLTKPIPFTDPVGRVYSIELQ